jgi:DDE superfamily endonuclease/Helix-turn-helix of DDE superfamily endonuclease
LRSKRTTGLSAEQFLALCELVTEAVGTWQPTTGRPRALSLNKAVKVTVMYLKNNITQEVIGELLTVSQPTVSRVITELEPIIGDVLDGYVPDLATEVTGRVAVVDGTLCPCWSWADAPELYSGKHKTTGHNHQLVCDLTGTLLHISDPVDGRTHDTKAITDTGLLTTLDATNTIGDKGYLGTGVVTPFRKPAGGELNEWQKEFNTTINKMRWVIEQAIANFKTWRCMHTDYRCPRHTYPTTFHAVRALHFFKLRYE